MLHYVRGAVVISIKELTCHKLFQYSTCSLFIYLCAISPDIIHVEQISRLYKLIPERTQKHVTWLVCLTFLSAVHNRNLQTWCQSTVSGSALGQHFTGVCHFRNSLKGYQLCIRSYGFVKCYVWRFAIDRCVCIVKNPFKGLKSITRLAGSLFVNVCCFCQLIRQSDKKWYQQMLSQRLSLLLWPITFQYCQHGLETVH